MQYSVFFLSAIAATGALAAPASSSMKIKDVSPMGLRISLEGQPTVDLNADNFDSDKELTHKLQHQGPFSKVTLTLGKQVKNQDVRCQLLDDQQTPKPIIMTRGENVDINFSMGKPWTFTKQSKATVVKCGPTFKKTDQTTVKEIKVTLTRAPQSGTVQTQDFSSTNFEEDKLPQDKAPEGASPNKKFDQVKLAVGLAIKNRALRCQALDKAGMPIIVTRGANIDETFSDGDNPKVWTFANGASEVSKIVCDPMFKKGDASGKVKKPATNMLADNGDDMVSEGMEEQSGMVMEPTVVVN